MAVKSKRVTVFEQEREFFIQDEKTEARKNIGIQLVSPNGSLDIEYDTDPEAPEAEKGLCKIDVNERTQFLIGKSFVADESGYEPINNVGSTSVKVELFESGSIQPSDVSEQDIKIIPESSSVPYGIIGLKNGTYTYSVIFEVVVTSETSACHDVTVHVGGDSFTVSIDTSYLHTQTIAFSNVAVVPRNETSTLPISIEISRSSEDYNGEISFKLSKISVHKVGTRIVGATENVIELLKGEDKTDGDIASGVLDVNGNNILTNLTIGQNYTGDFAINVTSTDEDFIPNFVIEIDNQSSADINLTVTKNGTPLKACVIAGTTIAGGNFYQLTCIGSCWTLAQFQ